MKSKAISLSQLTKILILNIIGAGILSIPRLLAEKVGTSGWIVLLLGGIATLFIIQVHGWIIKCFPEKSLKEIVSVVLSKPLANLYLIIFIIYLLVLNGLLLRIFAEVMKMFLLLQTPTEVIMICVLITSVFLSRRGIETLGKLSEVLIPSMLFFSVILFALTLLEGKVTNLLPVFDTSIMEILRTSPSVFFSFLGFDLVLVFGRYVRNPSQIRKTGRNVVISVTSFYLIINTCILLVFGSDQTQYLIWPTLSLFKTIQFPGLFIENVEAFVMALWVVTIFMSIAPTHLATAALLGQLTNSKDYGYFALPLVPIIYYCALWVENIAAAYQILDRFTASISLIIAVLFPIFMMIVIRLRGLHKKEVTNSDQG